MSIAITDAAHPIPHSVNDRMSFLIPNLWMTAAESDGTGLNDVLLTMSASKSLGFRPVRSMRRSTQEYMTSSVSARAPASVTSTGLLTPALTASGRKVFSPRPEISTTLSIKSREGLLLRSSSCDVWFLSGGRNV